MGWFSQPVSNYRELIGRWDQAELFFLNPDQLFSLQTGLFVELFVHKEENEIQRILSEPSIIPTMRFISNHEPHALRTYFFKDLIRQNNPRVDPNFYLSMRYGFWECTNNQSLIIVKALSG
jgi:hypothetical protein